MTNRQTIDELLARLTEDLTEARLEAASAAVRAERERADRHRAEAAAYKEILEDVRESLELLVPVPACAIPAQSILDELHRRNLHTHPTDAPVTAAAAMAALGEVLDGVEAVLGRVADAGGPVVVPVGLVADADGWYPHDGTTWPACAPGDEVDYWLRDGDVNRDIVGMLQWSHNGGLSDIIAWRPVRDGGPDKRDI